MNNEDIWTKNHLKNNSYFEEIFYSLIDEGFELLEVYRYYGKDYETHIKHESVPKNGYKPAYGVQFNRLKKSDYTYTPTSKIDDIERLLGITKSCCKRLKADLGPTYVEFSYDRIQIDAIHDDILEADDLNEDLIDFQSTIIQRVSYIENSTIRKEELDIIKTDSGLILNVGTLSRGQLLTLNKHINRISTDWQGWIYAETRYRYMFDKEIDKSKKMTITFIKRESRDRI